MVPWWLHWPSPIFPVFSGLKVDRSLEITTKLGRCRPSHLKGRLDWGSFLCAISRQNLQWKTQLSYLGFVVGRACTLTLRVFDSCDTTQHMCTTGYFWKINDWRVYPDCFSIGLSIGSTFWTRKKARHQMRRLFEDVTDWHRHTTELKSSFESE